MPNSDFTKGLQDVVAAESAICWLDGVAGRFTYRGIEIQELAEKSTFEETTYYLWFGKLPTKSELAQFNDELVAARKLPDGLHPLLQAIPSRTTPMDALRTAISATGHFDPDAGDESPAANRRKAVRIFALVPMVIAAFYRFSHGQRPLAPRPDLNHAGSFLYLLTGKEPTKYQRHVLDVALILHADHELNASTFAARVTAGTLSDIYSAITSAVGALKGPLHGGANEAVMRMLRRVGAESNGAEVVRSEYAAGRKLPGFGHRVYRTWDPRALVLRAMACPIDPVSERPVWCRLQSEIEEEMVGERKVYPNVDFYSGTLYDSIGIPIELFTPVFAISRVAGWLAHVLEQYSDNRLIRPRAAYIGPDKVEYVPIADRRESANALPSK